jgi:hypothetical protein
MMMTVRSEMSLDDALVRDAIAASSGTGRVYEIRHVPDHAYSKGPKGARGCKALIGGVACGKARAHPDHHLPTMNETLTQDWKVYQGALRQWKPYLVERLAACGLPRGLESVLVEGLCCFPTRSRPDQGNHRAFVEKALGDALQEGGYIPEDTWERYEFGNLQRRVVAGERWTELRLFPNALGGEGVGR